MKTTDIFIYFHTDYINREYLFCI